MAWALVGILAVSDVVLSAVVFVLVRSQERMTRAISMQYRVESEVSGKPGHYSMYKSRQEVES